MFVFQDKRLGMRRVNPEQPRNTSSLENDYQKLKM